MGTCKRVSASAAILVAIVLTTAGCGAIFNGTRQTLTATSAPDGAKVTADPGIGDYTTPASLSLERKNNYVLRFEMENYRPATFQIGRQMQGGILALDILFTGLLGVVIDAATGAWYKLSPESAVVSLTRITSGPGPETIDVYISAKGNALRLESSAPGVSVHVQPER
jgi:hypothetical protein